MEKTYLGILRVMKVALHWVFCDSEDSNKIMLRATLGDLPYILSSFINGGDVIANL